VFPANVGPDPDGDAPDAGLALQGAVIPLDSASAPTERGPERRRKRRRTLHAPGVPTFIKVGPGRYIRAEEPASSSDATAPGGGEEDRASGIQDAAASPLTTTEESLVNGVAVPGDRTIALSSSADDPGGDVGIEEVLTHSPSLDAVEVAGSVDVPT
jgi:hypothetical protein